VRLNGGAGAAVETRLLARELFYVFIEADASYGNAYERNHRVGGGGTAGLLADLGRRWKIHLFVTALSFPLGERSSDIRSSLQQRMTLTQNLALRLELNRRDHQDEAIFTVHAYF
jgi:hypothetical protein